MKKTTALFIVLFAGILFNACKKNSVDEQFTETVNPVVPDLVTQVNSNVSGFVADENGNAVAGANVKGGSVTVVTDAYGYFKIKNASFAKSAGFVEVTKTGFFTAYRTFIPAEGKDFFVRVQLLTKTTTGSTSSATGGTVSIPGDASVTLPSNAVVVAAGGAAYTGTVHVSMRWLDPSDMQTTQQTMPGDLRGIDSSGYLKALATYGMMAVELSGSSGEKLQIANGSKASLSFPIPSSLMSNAPNTIPLWYFNESNGLWVQQGTAVKNGNKYDGEVTHFSYWNCDVPYPLVNFTVQVLNEDLAPLVNVAVNIRIEGIFNSTRTCYTDSKGAVKGMIPANSNLVMEVMSVCNAPVFQQSILTTNDDVDLGSISVNMQQYGATFKGSVNKCSGLPVTDGYVIILSGSNTQVAEIQNGLFNISGTICANMQGHVLAIDRETSQQSTVLATDFVAGINDFGVLSACAPVTENITYVLDGVTTVLALPQHLFGGVHDYTGNGTTNINAIDLLNGSVSVFSLWVSGQPGTGTFPTTGTLYLNQVQYLYPAGNPDITISNFGLIGEFITGSITCTIQDVTVGLQHTFTCTFNIKRDS